MLVRHIDKEAGKMDNMKLWRVKGRYTTEYIRANSLDDAAAIFKGKHAETAMEFQVTDETIQAVYFTDNPYSAAYFKGCTKEQARRSGNLYIRQWNLGAVIDRIVTM